MDEQTAIAELQPSSAVPHSPPSNAVILGDIHGQTFSCRINLGADDIAISDTIFNFFGHSGHFLPILLPTSGRNFEAVDGHAIKSLGKYRSVRSSTPLPNLTGFATSRL